jgi:hypothetical protein
MFAVMRQTRKSCLAFKILAAGRVAGSPESLDAAFKSTFAAIKSRDCVIVGIYRQFKEEIEEDAQRVRAYGGMDAV